jgi:dephospho-CoA kinase
MTISYGYRISLPKPNPCVRSGSMLNMGLTGSIACGKSTVARMFVEKGAFHIDFDRLAHQVEEPDQPAWKRIVDCFGTGILNPDRTINRARLGAIVFEDREKLAKLNSIVHPEVFTAWHRRLDEIRQYRPDAIVISDVPLLIEAGMQSLVDVVALVYVSPEEQIRRLVNRDGCTRREAEARFGSQMSIDEKKQYAHIVIDNQGTVEATQKIVDQVWQDLLAREKDSRTDGPVRDEKDNTIGRSGND